MALGLLRYQEVGVLGFPPRRPMSAHVLRSCRLMCEQVRVAPRVQWWDGICRQAAVVQSLSCAQLCDPMDCSTPASLSFTISWSLLKLMPLIQWHYPTISSSIAPFSSCPQSFPASGSSPMGWLYASHSQSIGVSASILPMNSKDWFPLGLTGLISLQSKGLARVFSNTTIQKHWFFGVQLYL